MSRGLNEIMYVKYFSHFLAADMFRLNVPSGYRQIHFELCSPLPLLLLHRALQQYWSPLVVLTKAVITGRTPPSEWVRKYTPSGRRPSSHRVPSPYFSFEVRVVIAE